MSFILVLPHSKQNSLASFNSVRLLGALSHCLCLTVSNVIHNYSHRTWFQDPLLYNLKHPALAPKAITVNAYLCKKLKHIPQHELFIQYFRNIFLTLFPLSNKLFIKYTISYRGNNKFWLIITVVIYDTSSKQYILKTRAQRLSTVQILQYN